ncbi:mitotic spindle assembly checkpoint protein MAD2B-like [Argiope bruennichi]|uniref:Mitotic spindle assembly checkpoint protein like n=1 Tax=Argiope bruennichi TaxID=94029 RepID=A0A8T0F5W7_ARGBR|nr:mitotic spindle assembly checkpoint protein MAD2B-like [Argiope bruennichi]KAF8785708.1 Mitotic spindle assembly checkpoint protein like [Argiope bruennichi]
MARVIPTVPLADIPELRSSVGLCGFMEVVIHHLLFVKNVYPKEAFSKSVRKNVTVWKCDCPEVQKYIINFLNFAHKVLIQKRKITLGFVLCRRNNEVIEEFDFEFKVHDLFVESESQLVCLLDNLISICEDIHKTNTFFDFNTVNSGAKEITFELQIVFDPDEVEDLPNQDPEYPMILHRAPAKNPLKKVTQLKKERNKTYEVKAFALKKM